MKKVNLAKEKTPKDFGKNLYCVGVTKSISKQELFVRADNIQVNDTLETLYFITILPDGSEEFTLILTNGTWSYCYLVNENDYPESIETWVEKYTYSDYKEKQELIRKEMEEEQRKIQEEKELMEQLEAEEKQKSIEEKLEEK